MYCINCGDKLMPDEKFCTDCGKKAGVTEQKPTKAKKFDLSFKRIVSRVLLTGIIGIIFGIAMLPFLIDAGGLLYEQKAAIGNQNMIRMVVLWGIFTLIVFAFTFWKKHFRMISIFLIICWVTSIVFLVVITIRDNNSLSCKRATPYVLDSEFNRALDLIQQRLDIENNVGTYWANAYAYRNCLDIKYSEESKNLGLEGLFFTEDPKLQDLQILVSPDYKTFDDLTISTLLVHELVHVGQFVNDAANNTVSDCFKSEAEAFTGQSMLINQLNNEEVRSIYSRIRENVDANPTFSILLDIQQLQDEAYNACIKLKSANSLSDEQFNECVWTGTQNKLETIIREDEYYIKQCANDTSFN